ncbi:hypothetical protein [Streptomyces sp. NPDC048442]|uniref:hypothetical protein n=1 Tax=Streptomyces sp. NPDC048442 TaxID=3154823 RepID=UPI0034179ECD
MGGLRHFRNRGTSAHVARIRRGVSLLCAVAALFGALLVCLGPAAGAGGGEVHAGSAAEAAAFTPVFPASPAYNCPYGQGDCGVFPHASPAVLTAPPLEPLPGTVAPQVRHGGDGGVVGITRGDGAWARAPGAHVLMVLRR